MRRAVIPLAVLVALVALDAAVRFARARREAAPAASSLVADPYPLRAFVAQDIDGRDVSTTTWNGKVVVVNFWATWCAPCRREIPALSALQARHGNRVMVIGVLQDSVGADTARQFAASVGMRYALVPSSFEIEQSFPSVEVLPMTFVISPQGEVVAIHAGEVDPAELGRQIDALLSGSTDR